MEQKKKKKPFLFCLYARGRRRRSRRSRRRSRRRRSKRKRRRRRRRSRRRRSKRKRSPMKGKRNVALTKKKKLPSFSLPSFWVYLINFSLSLENKQKPSFHVEKREREKERLAREATRG